MKTLNYLIALGMIIVISSCSRISDSIDGDLKRHAQYGDKIIEFSSEYSAAPGPWSTFVVLGAPDTYPEYGDKQTAWASTKPDNRVEVLSIGFDTAQYVNHISIYETFNPGAVAIISVRNTTDGSWVQVYEEGHESGLEREARIMEIDFPLTTFLVDAIKLDIATGKVTGWNEIDAVSISGFIPDLLAL